MTPQQSIRIDVPPFDPRRQVHSRLTVRGPGVPDDGTACEGHTRGDCDLRKVGDGDFQFGYGLDGHGAHSGDGTGKRHSA